jgi:phage shock protein C
MADTSQPQVDVHDASLAGARAWFVEEGLTRPRHGRVIGGVCAGFARKYGVNVLVVRMATIVGVVVLTPLVYLPLWALMPRDTAA